MTTRFIMSALLVLMCGFGRTAETGGFWDHAYINVSGGGNWTDDLRSPSGSYSFDPGYRVGVAPGFRPIPYAAIEVELGFMWNTVNDRTTAAGTVKSDGDFWRVPFLINVIGQYPLKDFTPYVGFGGGVIYQDFSASGAGFNVSDTFRQRVSSLGGIQLQTI